MFPDAPIGSGFAHPCFHGSETDWPPWRPSSYCPVSIVQMSWRGMSDIPSKQYASDDLVGAPSVFGANSSLPALRARAGRYWRAAREQPGRAAGESQAVHDPGPLDEFTKDQLRLQDEVIFEIEAGK